MATPIPELRAIALDTAVRTNQAGKTADAIVKDAEKYYAFLTRKN